MGKTIGYWYLAAQGHNDIIRLFTLEKNKVQDKVESWGYIDGLEGKVIPTQMLFVVPDSPKETKLFISLVGVLTVPPCDSKLMNSIAFYFFQNYLIIRHKSTRKVAAARCQLRKLYHDFI
jgi:hypothetical protein